MAHGMEGMFSIGSSMDSAGKEAIMGALGDEVIRPDSSAIDVKFTQVYIEHPAREVAKDEKAKVAAGPAR